MEKKKTVLLICTPCVGWQAKHGHRMGGGVAQSPERTGPREERTKARRCSEVDLCVAPSLPSSLTKRRLDGRFARETLVCGGGVVRERNGQPGDANHALLLRCSHFLFPRRRCAAKQFSAARKNGRSRESLTEWVCVQCSVALRQ